jgi:hypothetical protein
MIYSWAQFGFGALFTLLGLVTIVFCRRVATLNYRWILVFYDVRRIRSLLLSPVLYVIIGIGFLVTGVSGLVGSFSK